MPTFTLPRTRHAPRVTRAGQRHGRSRPPRGVQEGPSPRRGDIEGLRGVAIALVMGFHLRDQGVSGGVDVFFVVSAYLLTRYWLRAGRRVTWYSVWQRWCATFGALLPQQALVVVAVVAVAPWLLSPWRFDDVVAHGLASLGGALNYVFAAQSVDYYGARNLALSPLQHMWSLAVQAHIFVLWPLVMLTGQRLADRARLSPALTTGWLLAVVGIINVGWASYAVRSDAVSAYFVTHTRLWEFCLGGLVACLTMSRTPPALPRRGYALTTCAHLAVLAGLVAITTAGWISARIGANFPGPVALLPTVGAALVLAAGPWCTPNRWSAHGLLCSRPLRWLGSHAYGVYLWHWPLYVGYISWFRDPHPSLVAACCIAGGSIVLSYVSRSIVWGLTRVTFTSSRPGLRWLAAAGIAASSCLAVSAFASPSSVPARLSTAAHPGAAVLDGARDPGGSSFIPSDLDVSDQWTPAGEPCLVPAGHPSHDLLSRTCHQVGDPAVAATRVVVLGDSHAAQLTPSIVPVANLHGWHLQTLAMGGCRYSSYALSQAPEHCAEFMQAAREMLVSDPPDVVIVVGTKSVPTGAREIPVPGLYRGLEPLLDAGITVVAVRDNPRFSANPYVCALQAETVEQRRACGEPLSTALPGEQILPDLRARDSRIRTMDLSDIYCPEGYCPPVVGNVAVYMDDNHISRLYGESIAPAVARRLLAELAL